VGQPEPAPSLGAPAKRGFIAGQKLVGRLLKRLNFSLQANCKTREGANHPDRKAQFRAYQRQGENIPGRRATGDLRRHEEEKACRRLQEVGFLLRMIQYSLETKGFLIAMLRRRTPSAPAPIFCFLAHINVFNILLANDPRCHFAELLAR
jgi:hypothetical protein